MNNEKLKWCLLQKNGISLVDINKHLSEAYRKEADETLDNVFSTKGKWKTITAYYACYSALYSIFMLCGIKSEIHECSLELMGFFEFSEGEIKFLKALKENRIKAQYYLKEIVFNDEDAVKRFVLRCKQITNNLNSSDIENIRQVIKEL